MYKSLIVVMMLAACAKESSYVSNSNNEDVDYNSDEEGCLLINEFSPKSNLLNEFGEESDWIELYNPGAVEFVIGANSISLTDDSNEPEKFFIPAMTIPAYGRLMIWCDENDKGGNDIHSGFKLSGKGEEICLFQNGHLVDEISFNDEVKKSNSYGREEDGATTWVEFDLPSPGTKNQSANHYAETIQ